MSADLCLNTTKSNTKNVWKIGSQDQKLCCPLTDTADFQVADTDTNMVDTDIVFADTGILVLAKYIC